MFHSGTQQKFGDALDWRPRRPDLVPAFFAKFTDEYENGRDAYPCSKKKPMPCDLPRRDDKMKQEYGTGVPTMNSTRVNVWGVPGKGPAKKYDEIGTPSGPLRLPVTVQEMNYAPLIDTLNQITHADTRLLHKPLRYFP